MRLDDRVRWWFKRFGAVRITGVAILLLSVSFLVFTIVWLIADGVHKEAQRVASEREFIRQHTVMRIGDKRLIKFTRPDGVVCNGVVRDLHALDSRNIRCGDQQ